MGSAKWYLLNSHVTCILLDWGITVLTVPYLILPVIGGYPLGILRWFGVPIVVQIYVSMTMVSFTVTSIVLIFENRFYQLYAINSSWRYLRIPFIITNYLLDATHVLPACLMVPDQKVALEFAYKRIPNLSDETKAETLFFLGIDFWIQIPYFLIGLKTAVQVCLFIWLINRNMSLESRRFTRSENTTNLQRKFLKAIKAQLMVLAINFLLPQTYTMVSFITHYYNQFANNLVIIAVSLHGINSTLIMLWAHKTYREYCFTIFKKIRSVLGCTSVSAVSPTSSLTVLT
ncbi:Protein CBG26749 [Caenorhabditis briggsae]|uniref:Protein CBG26749 n=1 Tax=Caenorhabditis briggsae TaxID=6238 RepID=B6IEC4_CAEBR|nr:Protein CBG26749 [Caenorhabditis briggsae]CAS01188.1 Protein CBG26749 [Caenorhabditis briggsae]